MDADEQQGARFSRVHVLLRAELSRHAGVLYHPVPDRRLLFLHCGSDRPQLRGTENYINVWQNGAFKIAVRNTFTFTGLSVPLAVVLSLGLALMLEARIPLKSEFRTFFLSPMMVPIASIILIWQVLFHYNGVVNEFLAVFGADKIDWLKSDYCMVVIVVLFLWKTSAIT